MCVLYVSFGSKVRDITFGCVAIGSAVLFILRSRLLVYSAGSGVNTVQVILSGFSVGEGRHIVVRHIVERYIVARHIVERQF